MNYIDGFVAAVPSANRDAYQRYAQDLGELFKKHGAIGLTECWGDDVPPGKLTSFPLAVQCQPDETVVFSWIVWPSRAVRDAGWKTLMTEPQMQPANNPGLFDGKRMIYGGFQAIVSV